MSDKTELQAMPPQELAVSQEDSGLMNLIAKMATDPAADIGKLERLIQLRDHVLAQEAKKQFDADFSLMKPLLPKVIRTHDNTQTKSKYADLGDINSEIDPILGKFGFGTSSKVTEQTETSVTMLLQLRHKGGHYDEMSLTMPIDDKGAQGSVNKTKVHGISSTITYIKRVGFCALLNISTGDDKDGNTESNNITVEQAAEMDLRLRAISDKALPNFLKWGKVEKLTDIPAKQYNGALKAISDMEQSAKKAKDQSHV